MVSEIIQIGTLIGVAIAAIGSLLAAFGGISYIKQYLQRPKLKIIPGEINKENQRFHISFEVKNESDKNSASNLICEFVYKDITTNNEITSVVDLQPRRRLSPLGIHKYRCPVFVKKFKEDKIDPSCIKIFIWINCSEGRSVTHSMNISELNNFDQLMKFLET